MSSSEIESFRIRFAYEFDRLLETIAGLNDEAVNWKPPAPGANSSAVSDDDLVMTPPLRRGIVLGRGY